MGKIIFVTGTDTGVGKTLLTALLLFHLRSQGKKALAMKPFCSGGRGDAELLHSLEAEDIGLEELNPFHFKRPIAPYLAATKKELERITLEGVAHHILTVSERCDYLLVEGAGGLFVPLGENWFVKDLIEVLDCEVILVSRNRLGTINHTLLSAKTLEKLRLKRGVKVVLMGQKKPDFSAATNGKYLREALAGTPVVSVGFQGAGASRVKAIKATGKKLKIVLAPLV
ncbi:MAG: dethiobiotin synthase, partial [Verrucomicrobiales bacterium]|nr:dethiobiotin synthase [Verrucomicrobiales bacterium]